MIRVLLLVAGAILAGLVIRRDARDLEAHDAEVGLLVLVGLAWSCAYGLGWWSALIGVAVLVVPLVVTWALTRRRDPPMLGEGDLLMGAALGAWVGIDGLFMTLILAAPIGFGLLAAQQLAKPAAERAWRNQIIPMAPALLGAGVLVLVLHALGAPVFFLDIEATLFRMAHGG